MTMATLWAKTATFESIQVGDTLPILVKSITDESIGRYLELGSTDKGTDPEPVSGDGLNPGPATVAYIMELLEKAFRLKNLMARGSRLETQFTEPIRAGDTITVTGGVTGKRLNGDQRLVEYEAVATNQRDEAVATAEGEVAF